MQLHKYKTERYCLGECDNLTPHLEIDDDVGDVIIICDVCGHTAESLKLSDDFYGD